MTALAYPSILLALYSATILFALAYFLKLPMVIYGREVAEIFAVAGACLFYLFPYYFLIKGDYYKEIISQMSALHETKLQSRIRSFLIFTNFVFVFLLFTFIAALPQLF